MGGFSAQVQPNQSSAPAGKSSGMSANQIGMNPIEQSPDKQMMKMQQLQMEQPNLPQMEDNGQAGTQIGGLGGLLGAGFAQQLQNPSQSQIGGLGGLMGGKITMPGQGGQPQLGMPNAYSNTLQPWDNQVQQKNQGLGKGFGNGV